MFTPSRSWTPVTAAASDKVDKLQAVTALRASSPSLALVALRCLGGVLRSHRGHVSHGRGGGGTHLGAGRAWCSGEGQGFQVRSMR